MLCDILLVSTARGCYREDKDLLAVRTVGEGGTAQRATACSESICHDRMRDQKKEQGGDDQVGESLHVERVEHSCCHCCFIREASGALVVNKRGECCCCRLSVEKTAVRRGRSDVTDSTKSVEGEPVTSLFRKRDFTMM